MATDTPLPKNGKKPKNSSKVSLKPGFHLVDWMRLIGKSRDMSGLKGGPLRNVTMKELRQHKSRYDCWTAYNGKVYNIGPYIPFHPGGEEMLMRGAGRDCTAMYNKFHAWVNFDNLMGKSLVGKLIVDTSTINEDEEEEEDDEGSDDDFDVILVNDSYREDIIDVEKDEDIEKEVEVKLNLEEKVIERERVKSENKEDGVQKDVDTDMKSDINEKKE